VRPLRIGVNARCLEEADTRGLSRYASCLLRRVVVFGGRDTEWQDRLLPARLRSERIDLFHAPADRGLPWRRPCPQVVTVHDSFERAHWRELFPTWKQRAWYWKHELTNRYRSDAVLTVSDTATRDLTARGVVPAARATRIYLAPADEFRAEPAPGDVATREAHEVREPYVLYVGGYDRRKNVDALVRAFDRLDTDRHLVIIARKTNAFHEQAAAWRTLRCAPRLRCIEAPAADLPAFYRGATLFVNPSLWESFSFQTLEAMASGTPVIASNRMAIPEIAGDAAVLVDAADVGTLATTMAALIGDRARRESLRERGLRRAAAFSWQATADNTLQVYRRVLASRTA
jgi:alpha-1,3-rhamnosyl/mannosyltransferase